MLSTFSSVSCFHWFFGFFCCFYRNRKNISYVFSNVPFSSKMFPSSLLISTMFSCPLVDFGHVPLFPGILKRPSLMLLTMLYGCANGKEAKHFYLRDANSASSRYVAWVCKRGNIRETYKVSVSSVFPK